MSEVLTSGIDLLHPTVSGIGVITTDQVWVLFDREIDETTIAGGNFFVTGPDFDTWIGPDSQLFNDAANAGSGSDDILESPGFEGIVQGDITFERYALDSLTTVSGTDTTGSGHLYRTRAIFTPTNRLQSNTDYLVHLSGDEDDTDSLYTGLSARTVYDTVTSGANLSTATVAFDGGYIGNLAQDTYRVEITKSGEIGTSKFRFSRDSDPLTVFGPFKTRRAGVLLSDGVVVEFDEGIYSLGDQWSAVVKERNVFTGNIVYPFMTGAGNILDIPTTTATTVLGDAAPASTSTSSSTSTFTLDSTVPADETSNVTVGDGEFEITATFSDTIDPTTVTSGVSVTVVTESVNGDPAIPASGICAALPAVSGSDITITVADTFIKNNNLVTVTFDSTIANTSGTTLGSDQEIWFTTAYSPMYCTERKLRLNVGAFIGDVSTDTINLAIFEASLMTEHLTWNTADTGDAYYQFARSQWTCCKAAEILLINTTGASGSLKSKKLGDLAVEYNTSSSNVNTPLLRAQECMERWEDVMRTGGRQVQGAKMVVRGELDVDRPPVGRGWLHSRDHNNAQIPAANRRLRPYQGRRFRNLHSRYGGKKGWWNS